MLDCRAAAARVLAAVNSGQSLERQLALIEPSVRERDRALLRELCYGSLRWRPQLVALTRTLLQKPLKARDADIEQLLLVGAYQLLHTRIPPHAALSATVDAARHLDKTWAAGMINAVLRRLQRELDGLLTSLAPAARVAHPQWLWQALQSAWPEQAESIFTANNAYPPMCLRVNSQRSSRAAYLEQLASAHISAKPCLLASDGIRLEQPCDVGALPGFADGAASVQDEAAQLTADLLNTQPGQRVLDACCAPGGKTGHVLERQPDLAELVGLDVSAERLKRVASNLQRLALRATLIAGDALAPADWWDGQPFDRILLDAPCSGTGVIRRHPDIKTLRTPGDIEQLAGIQLQLLDTLWPLLGDGGELLYATCSVLPAENTRVIERFLDATPTAREIPIEADWGLAQPVGRQLLPSIDGCDGFYYARLRKTTVN